MLPVRPAVKLIRRATSTILVNRTIYQIFGQVCSEEWINRPHNVFIASNGKVGSVNIKLGDAIKTCSTADSNWPWNAIHLWEAFQQPDFPSIRKTALVVGDSIAKPLRSALKEILPKETSVAFRAAPKIDIDGLVCEAEKYINTTEESIAMFSTGWLLGMHGI